MTKTSFLATGQCMLEMHWKESPFQEVQGVQLGDITSELTSLRLLVAMTEAIAAKFEPDAPVEKRIELFEPRVQRLQFGSPLFVELALIHEVAESIAAISFLAFAINRFWSIDLEMRAHREEARLRLLKAKEQSVLAEKRLQDARKTAAGSALESPEAQQIKQDYGWGEGAYLPGKRPKAQNFYGHRATLWIDPDDF